MGLTVCCSLASGRGISPPSGRLTGLTCNSRLQTPNSKLKTENRKLKTANRKLQTAYCTFNCIAGGTEQTRQAG
jgi:hypothetical protein